MSKEIILKTLIETLFILFMFILGVLSTLFIQWITRQINIHKKITNFLKEKLKPKDYIEYDDNFKDYEHSVYFVVEFCQKRLNEKDFEIFKWLIQ